MRAETGRVNARPMSAMRTENDSHGAANGHATGRAPTLGRDMLRTGKQTDIMERVHIWQGHEKCPPAGKPRAGKNNAQLHP